MQRFSWTHQTLKWVFMVSSMLFGTVVCAESTSASTAVATFSSPISYQAVSYTHLDVYKRQERCIVCLYWISIRIHYRHLAVELILNLVTAIREWRSGGAPTND